MSEDKDLVQSGSKELLPSDIFEQLLKSIHERKKLPRTYVGGESVLDAEEWSQVEEWLSKKANIVDIVAKGIRRRVIGLVHDMSLSPSKTQTHVHYINQYGETWGFVLNPNDDFYSGIKDIKEGDFILEDMEGDVPLSIKKLNLSPEHAEKVLNKIRKAYEKNQ